MKGKGILLNMLVCLYLLVAVVLGKDEFNHGIIYVNPGGYDKLPKEVRDFLNSADPADRKLNKHIVVKESSDGV